MDAHRQQTLWAIAIKNYEVAVLLLSKVGIT